MTPEEILKEFATTIVISPPMAIRAKSKAIEAIKQYAREMCDKQRQSSLIAWGGVYSGKMEDDGDAILNSPYPKELQ